MTVRDESDAIDAVVLRQIDAALSLLPRHGTVVVAVSGGPDSMCLLHTLHRRSGSDSLLIAVHVDHRLRDGSAHDLAVVSDRCDRLGIALVARRVDVRAQAKEHKQSIETAARELRQSALRDVAAQIRARFIALGHTADDQVETVLMHVLRGAGVPGLAGMGVADGDWFRPLLGLTREQTTRYCDVHELEYVLDPSNDDPRFTRNRVRHELLPLVESIYPGGRAALLRLAEIAHRDTDFMETMVREAADLWRFERPDGSILGALPPSLQYYVVRSWLAGSNGAPVERDTISRVVEELAHDQSGVVGSESRLRLPYSHLAPPSGVHPLRMPGRTRLEGFSVSARIARCDEEIRRRLIVSPRWVAYLDADVLPPGLEVRRRRAGDRVRPLGSPGTRKLQDVFVDAKIPRAERDRVPIVDAAGSIAWVAGVTVEETYRVTKRTSRVVVLSVHGEGG